MKLTDANFYELYGAALDEPDQDRYLAEWSSSSLFYPDPDGDGPDPGQLAALLSGIWDAAHITVKELRARTGLSQAAFCARYLIPRRTLEDWEAGRRDPPPYVRQLLLEAAGLYTRP